MVDSLSFNSDATLRRYSRLCARVAAGRSFRLASKSPLARSFAFGHLPEFLLGCSDPSSRAILA